MKTTVISFLLCLFWMSLSGQAPQKMSYQAVIRSTDGNLVTNKTVGMRISVIKGPLSGSTIYSETQKPTTNTNGLVTIEIGGGPGFDAINWGDGIYFIKTETDPAGGSNYTISGTSQLLSVPYALYARDVQNNNDADADITNEIQALSISGNSLSLNKGGGNVTIPGDNWGTQLAITDATLSGNGSTSSPLKIAPQRAFSGQVLKFDGTTWAPGNDLTGSGTAMPGGTTGQLQFNNNGTFGGAQKLFYDNVSGRLGIGTSEPVTNLTINGGLFDALLHFNNDSTGNLLNDGFRVGMERGSNNNVAWLWHYENSKIVFGTNNIQRMQISGNGNIGIGTSTPDYPLHVVTGYSNCGIFSENKEAEGYGIIGFASRSTGPNYGVKGESSSTQGFGVLGRSPYTGVQGVATSVGGANYGIFGTSGSPAGRGVYGQAVAVSGSNYGVFGESASATGYGVYGIAIEGSGINYGVKGESSSSQGFGVMGEAPHIAVRGIATSTGGANYGIFGTTSSPGGRGVFGQATAATGSNIGVIGESASATGYGVYGSATESSGANFGVKGVSSSSQGSGVLGQSPFTGVNGVATSTTAVNYGVKGSTSSSGGYSGYFTGGKFRVGSLAIIDSSLSMENHRINNVTNPVSAQDAATKAYVDAAKELVYTELLDAGLNGIVKDADLNTYKTIKIGQQVWMAENLKTTKYNDRTAIQNITDNTAWGALTTGAYCWYENNRAVYKSINGALYNGFAVQTGKLCPVGWHVPTDAEWTTLENYLIANGYNYDGTTTGNKISKSLAAHTNWNTSSSAGDPGNDPINNNSSGFSALPGGYRDFGYFAAIGNNGLWWSSTEFSTTYAWTRSMYYGSPDVSRSNNNEKLGFSVRCLRDN